MKELIKLATQERTHLNSHSPSNLSTLSALLLRELKTEKVCLCRNMINTVEKRPDSCMLYCYMDSVESGFVAQFCISFTI